MSCSDVRAFNYRFTRTYIVLMPRVSFSYVINERLMIPLCERNGYCCLDDTSLNMTHIALSGLPTKRDR